LQQPALAKKDLCCKTFFPSFYSKPSSYKAEGTGLQNLVSVFKNKLSFYKELGRYDASKLSVIFYRNKKYKRASFSFAIFL
jgi:hypothetical protein